MSGNITRRRALQIAAGAGASGLLAGNAGAEGRAPERVVGTTGPGGSRAARREAESVKRTLRFGDVGQAVAGRFSDEAARRLRRRDDVRYVERDGTMEAIGHATAEGSGDPTQEQVLPWGIDRVDADVVHHDGETGGGADIAIIDTGIDSDHEDLQANLGEGKAFVQCTEDCGGPPWEGNDNDCLEPWDDDNDHGSHCAGTADGVDNDVGVVGVSTEATLHAVKVLECDGSGSYSDVAAGIEWTADQGYDVGSLSLGGDESQTVRDACQYAYEKGVLLVAAAGNDGPCTDCVGYPAAYDTVVAVSATDENDDLADFSSTGPEVELAAPGVDVLSTVPIDDYDYFDGTSMACPHVSGAGGQLMANGYANTEARQRLRDTAEDIGLADNEQGHGLLDVEAAVAEEGLRVTTDDATDVTDSSATLNGTLSDLGGADSADVYFEWGPSGDLSNATDPQTLSSTGGFSDEVTGLESDTDYEFRAVAEASDGETDTGATVAFTTDGDCVDAENWPAGTGRDGDENIDELDLDGQVVETSAANAYEDFTCPDVVTVQQGGSFDVAMEWSDGGYDDHYANVFVDWDQNEDWSTADETVLMENVDDDTVTATATVDVPGDAPLGSTLVRVRLSWGGFDDPDATDEYGEVNDFTVKVE